MKSRPAITALEMEQIKEVLGMGGGYVLDFSDETFASFFADFGIDIFESHPGLSKGKTLQAFLRNADPHLAATVLEGLLKWRENRGG